MAMLQVRDMDDRLYERLRFAAKNDNRSISQQVITILQNYFTSVPVKTKNATEEFLKLAGSWEDFCSLQTLLKHYYHHGVQILLCRYQSNMPSNASNLVELVRDS